MVTQADDDPQGIQAQQWEGFSGTLGFEVGGNCGQTTGLMLSRFDQVVSFEPAVESMAVLRERFGDEPRVALSPLAVSDHTGTVELREVPHALEKGMLVTDIGEDYSSATLREVPCATLDWLASQWGVPDFVLIDVEGHEVAVMRGASEVLIKAGTSFLVEFHLEKFYDECVNIFQQANYVVEPVRHPHYAPGTPLWRGHGWLRATPK